MAKKINTNTQEWGNIELPGLSDDKLLSTNWNYVSAAKQRMSNPNTRKKLSESISKKQSDPDYLKHMSKQRNESMDKPVDETGLTLRQKLTIANRNSAKNPKHYANRCAANKKLKDDPNWKKAHAQGVLVYSEETMTPMGLYPSMSRWMKEHNQPGGRVFLSSLPHLFYQTKTGKGKPTYERIYHTPYGKCASDAFAYKLCQENNEPNSLKLRNIAGWWLKMAALHKKEYYITFEMAKYWPVEKDIPYGMLDLVTKPRLTKEKLKSIKQRWEERLKHTRTLYK